MKRLNKPRFIGPKYDSNSEMDLCYRLSRSVLGPIRSNMRRLRLDLAAIRRLSLFRRFI